MSTTPNIAIIQDLYTCFLRRQLDAVLAKMADDVVWVQPDNPVIPYSGRRNGRAGVSAFFTALSAVEIETFEAKEYVASGDHVLAIGSWSGRAQSTGKLFASAWVMLWKVVNGRVTYFRAYEDTAAVAAAFSQ